MSLMHENTVQEGSHTPFLSSHKLSIPYPTPQVPLDAEDRFQTPWQWDWCLPALTAQEAAKPEGVASCANTLGVAAISPL